MRSREIYSLILIAVISGVAIWINFAPDNRWLGLDVSIRQGLDLQGGTQVLLRADRPNVTDEELSTTLGVVERRVNALGVGETVVQRAGADRLIVELPGVSNPEQAVETLRGTGRLEFVDSQGQFIPTGTVVRTSGNPDPEALRAPLVLAEGESLPDDPTGGVVYNSITDGADLDTASVQPSISQGSVGSRPAVAFRFTGESGANLARFTGANVGNPMCIVLDSVIVSCPVINAPLTDGAGIIESNSQADADTIYNQLKFGALPVPLVVETTRTVSATLGQDSVSRSLQAGIAGLMIVAVFMTFFYRLPGLVAACALLLYTAISFAIYRMIPITLTLPGIAGFILSIGLAVDANVLIFARLREEYRKKKNFASALEAGFEESWSAIRDSSVATLITSGVLFLFGNSFGISIIKGFALNLGLGILISLFTAVVISRTFLRLLIPISNAGNTALFGLDHNPIKLPDTPTTNETAA